MVKINPIKLQGNWFEGFALDLHTVSSEFLGSDEFGHEIFYTKRSEIGELLYRLKYKSDKSTMEDIVETAVDFLVNQWKISSIIDVILPVPSSKRRAFQPVINVGREISSKMMVPSHENFLKKDRETPELKNIFDYHERTELLKDAFEIKNQSLVGKNILLFDDLYRSGATCNSITKILYDKGRVGKVYVLALTKTRSKT
ncbi:MAG: ComF family protein [Deltaproteobacteria bacterium]|nr:ComF family protein [Deltaproteobacteria bacterium]